MKRFVDAHVPFVVFCSGCLLGLGPFLRFLVQQLRIHISSRNIQILNSLLLNFFWNVI